MTYFSQGAAFSAAVMKSTILGAVSVVIYGIVARYTYIPLGLIGGTAASLVVSFASSYVIHGYLARRTM
jgi:fumarate reductase subunit D